MAGHDAPKLVRKASRPERVHDCLAPLVAGTHAVLEQVGEHGAEDRDWLWRGVRGPPR